MFPDRRQGLWLWPWLFQGSLPAVSRCQGDLDRKQLVPMRWKLLISHWLHLDGFAYWWLCNWKQRWWSSTFRVSFIYFQNRILKSFRDAWRVPDEPLLEKNWAMCLLPSPFVKHPLAETLKFLYGIFPCLRAIHVGCMENMKRSWIGFWKCRFCWTIQSTWFVHTIGECHSMIKCLAPFL